MARNETAETPVETPETPEANPEEIKGALTRKLEEAREAHTTLLAQFAGAMSSGDMKTVLELADKVKLAERNVEKAEKAVKDADFLARATERGEVTDALHAFVKANVEMYLQNEPRVLEFGMKAITVALNPDGAVNVSITGPSRPSGGTTGERKPKGEKNGTAAAKPRSAWVLTFDGNREVISADLLAEFGGEEGAKAIDRARNHEAYGMKLSPGFDVPLKKLARRMGWIEGEERVLTHLPE